MRSRAFYVSKLTQPDAHRPDEGQHAAGGRFSPFDPCFGCATDREAPLSRPREWMRADRVGTKLQTPRPSAPPIITRTIETDAARHGVSAGERTSRIDCRGSGIRGLHIAPFAGSERRRETSPTGEAVTSPSGNDGRILGVSPTQFIRRSSRRARRASFSINCRSLSAHFGRCLTQAGCRARLATPFGLGNNFSVAPAWRRRVSGTPTE